MRVFDTYYFNIIEKTSFKDTKPYLENMLGELGYSYKNIAFLLYDVPSNRDLIEKVKTRLPALEKYYFVSDDYGFTSFSTDWRNGKIYAQKDDWKDVSTLFSKIPRTYNFAFGKLILDNINWFGESDVSIAADCGYVWNDIPTRHEPPFKSSRIMQLRYFDDGKKFNHIYVTVEVTADGEPRDSGAIFKKLAPYLGEPLEKKRECVLSPEEFEKYNKLNEIYMERLKKLCESDMPASKGCIYSKEIIPHVADKFTLDKAFKGTGFTRQKGTPNWLHLYSCIDERGLLYEAYTQKISTGNEFRFWIEISGCNFKIQYEHSDYFVEREGESLEILGEIARFCVKLRETFGAELAGDFGSTPEWYNIFRAENDDKKEKKK